MIFTKTVVLNFVIGVVLFFLAANSPSIESHHPGRHFGQERDRSASAHALLNYIDDGDFEDPVEISEKPDSKWSFSNVGGKSGRAASRDKTTFFSGSASLKIAGSPSVNDSQFSIRRNFVIEEALPSSRFLSISFALKSTQKVTAECVVFGNLEDEVEFGLARIESRVESWQYAGFVAVVPPKARRLAVQIRFSGESSSAINLDAMSVVLLHTSMTRGSSSLAQSQAVVLQTTTSRDSIREWEYVPFAEDLFTLASDAVDPSIAVVESKKDTALFQCPLVCSTTAKLGEPVYEDDPGSVEMRLKIRKNKGNSTIGGVAITIDDGASLETKIFENWGTEQFVELCYCRKLGPLSKDLRISLSFFGSGGTRFEVLNPKILVSR